MQAYSSIRMTDSQSFVTQTASMLLLRWKADYFMIRDD